ncbi:DEAD/DEAH box helicase [Streptomyces sp. SKN60]|uniref:DEAD/DEAH box helicase n=1 Tax=Streptomyces sp. SKN60 TaxID=2855506 RepID=UPI002247A08D|nr:DEAD/DEAH box helicase [Streptomyces sp. SKN60]MCX2182742.1 DEAD/DEAH box helicase [Streptomyces sp. SKN60]
MNRSARTGDLTGTADDIGIAGDTGSGGRAGTPPLPAEQRFDAMGLPEAVLATLADQGLTTPFPIQSATLPSALAGRDVLGRGRTGSGKTLAFGLALLARTAGRRADAKKPLALVLVPTRELAQQVSEALAPYAGALRLRVATVVGGLQSGRQASELRAGAEVLVATPGRLRDLVERRDCRLDQVEITVLDEADQMADMGFLPQVTELLDLVRPGGQRMLFSATLDQDVELLVRRYLRDPVTHAADLAEETGSAAEHHVLQVQGAEKFATATEIAAREGRVIMFLDTKAAVDRFTRHLVGSGVRAAALHGGKSQPQRTDTLERFRAGAINVLVATNVAARGIHVDDLELVVNVDPPTDPKDYLHRGGRTARAGASGSVVTLALPDQRRDLALLLAEAGIRPRITKVRPGDAELRRITGAKAPAGAPDGGTAASADRDGRRGAAFRGIGTVPGKTGRARNESRKSAEARRTAEARKAARVRRGR